MRLAGGPASSVESRGGVASPPGLAAPRGLARSVLGFVLFVVLAASTGSIHAVAAASPSADPTQRPLTCAERYPDEGPAGLDLRLACIVTELVGAYTEPGDATTPPRVSDWLRPIGIVLALIILIWLVIRTATRRAAARLAPVVPASWWSCPACRSLNPTGTTACYRCREPWTPDLEVMTPADPPS